MGMSPKLVRFLRLHLSDPSFQALSLVFFLHLEKHGYADNIDGLLEVCRAQIPRFRTFQVLCLTLEQELPPLAKELSTPEKLWQKIKDLSEPEREQYLAGRTEHLREVYLQHERDLDAFWQRHPEIKNALESGDVSSPAV
jgi:hypothetical protein